MIATPQSHYASEAYVGHDDDRPDPHHRLLGLCRGMPVLITSFHV